ncbi:MAG: hypothetical protein PHD43_05050 [Methylococcales bacterium]|nr:hypothetical protein [Methylococcales bacterium]
MSNGTTSSLSSTTPAVTPKSEQYIALAELTQKSFNDRRIYEWKVNFSLWASVGLVVYAAASKHLVLFHSPEEAYTVAFFLLGFYCLFLIMVSRGHNTDKKWKHYYMLKAEGDNPQQPPITDKTSILTTVLWLLPSIAFTVLLLYIAIQILAQIQTSCPCQ